MEAAGQTKEREGRGLGFVGEAGFGGGSGEFVVVAEEIEKIRNKLPKTFKH